MITTVKQRKEEAISRMESLGVPASIIERFKRGYISISDSCTYYDYPFGEDTDFYRDFMAFQEKNDCLVYMIIRTAHFDSYLFVNNDDEEWEYDREDIENGSVLAYVKNWRYPEDSEFGDIGVVLNKFGVLERTW